VRSDYVDNFVRHLKYTVRCHLTEKVLALTYYNDVKVVYMLLDIRHKLQACVWKGYLQTERTARGHGHHAFDRYSNYSYMMGSDLSAVPNDSLIIMQYRRTAPQNEQRRRLLLVPSRMRPSVRLSWVLGTDSRQGLPLVS